MDAALTDATAPADFARELPSVPGGWAEQVYQVAGRRMVLTQPAVPDAFLDDPGVQEANRKTGYMPYWGFLWPTSLEMATAILEHPWTPGTPALELGAGVGLTGVAALLAGLDVTFSDYDPQSVQLCLHNARRNGFPSAPGLVLDWREPPASQYPVIIACELIYELGNHAPLLQVLEAMLAPEGVAWFADPGRHQAEPFLKSAREAGYSIAHRTLPRLPYAGRPEGVTNLYVLNRAERRD